MGITLGGHRKPNRCLPHGSIPHYETAGKTWIQQPVLFMERGATSFVLDWREMLERMLSARKIATDALNELTELLVGRPRAANDERILNWEMYELQQDGVPGSLRTRLPQRLPAAPPRESPPRPYQPLSSDNPSPSRPQYLPPCHQSLLSVPPARRSLP